MGGGDLRAHRGGRPGRGAARPLLRERRAERRDDAERHDVEQRSGQRGRAAVAEPEPVDLAVGIAVGITFGVAVRLAERLGAQSEEQPLTVRLHYLADGD